MDERTGHAGQGIGVDWGARVNAQNAGYSAHEKKFRECKRNTTYTEAVANNAGCREEKEVISGTASV